MAAERPANRHRAARGPGLAGLQILVAALLFSTGGAAIKATTLDSWQVASFRSAVAAAAVLALLPAARRNWSPRALLVGLAYAATMVLYVAGNKLTTAANTIFLQSTAPLYLLLLGPWLLKEPVRRSDVGLMALIAAGMSLFFVGEQRSLATAPDPFAGNVLSAISGVTWALTIAGLRWLERKEGAGGGMATVVAGNLIAFLACLPFAVPVEAARPLDWAVVVYLGIFQIGAAYWFLTRGIGRVPALETSLLLLAEPAVNPVWAWLVHGERPSGLALIGGGLILGGTLLNALRSGGRRAEESGTSRPRAGLS